MLIEIHNLTKVYNEKRGLLPTSFEVEKGELIAIVGHNGAGKSTLLKILANGSFQTAEKFWWKESGRPWEGRSVLSRKRLTFLMGLGIYKSSMLGDTPCPLKL